MPEKGKEIVDIEVSLIHERELAWLVLSTSTGKQNWVPKSLCELERVAGLYTLTLPTWMAEEKGLV